MLRNHNLHADTSRSTDAVPETPVSALETLSGDRNLGSSDVFAAPGYQELMVVEEHDLRVHKWLGPSLSCMSLTTARFVICVCL